MTLTPTRAAAAAIALLAAAALTACSSPGTSLADTKSPVQLLRNEAASRIDPAAVASIGASDDASHPCNNEEEDPTGRVRQWRSTVDVALVEGADRVATADALVTSFVDDGWEAKSLDGGSSFAMTILSRPGSAAQIQVAAADNDAESFVRITTVGPCVQTAGGDSDEVTQLETTTD